MKSGRWTRESGQTRATTFKGCRGIQDRLVSRQLPIVRSRSPRLDHTVSIAATMPWVDVGDTISVTGGTHQLKGTVLANTGSALSVLNCGYAGNNTGTVAAGSPISLCVPPSSCSDLISGRDDFLSFDAPTDGSPA